MSIPFTTSIKINNEQNLEMHADLAAETAEVVNLVDGKLWTGGGDSDAAIAKVTIKNSTTNREITMTAPAISVIDGEEVIAVYGVSVPPGDTKIYDILIYKDITVYPLNGEDIVATVSGNVELVDKNGEGWLLIKGDGEVDITAYTPF